MQENPAPSAPPKLRWYQYRLRTLLIFMTLVAIFFSWFGNRLRIAQSQRAAVEKLTQSKAMVMYDDKKKWPAWLEKLLGKDFCYQVKGIMLSKASEEQYKELEHIPNFRLLSIGDGKVTSEDFEHIQANKALEGLFLDADFPLEKIKLLKSLNTISLRGTLWTDDNLASLDGLDNLQDLRIYSDAITDRGLAKIKNLVNLKGFVLSSKSATGSGLAFLKSAKGLKTVNFFDTPVTDEMMEFLRDCKELECLVVQRGGSITEKGMSCLEDHVKLEQLCIQQPDVPITGKSLSYLEKCKSLWMLTLGQNTTITDEDFKALQNCTKLQCIAIINSKITGSGLEYLAKSKELNYLSLPGSDIRDENIPIVNQFPHKRLVLSGKGLTDVGIAQLNTKGISLLELPKTGITDKSISNLAKNQDLESLELGETSISIEGLKQLAGLKKLRQLYIYSTPAAEHLKEHPEDMQMLQSLLPTVDINSTKPQ